MRQAGERQIYVWCDSDTQDRAWIVSIDDRDDDGGCLPTTRALAVLFSRRDAIEVARSEARRRGLSIAIED